MVGYTPGPWHVRSQNDCLFVIDKPRRPSTDDVNPDHDVNVVAKLGHAEIYKEAEANARLIAAAPELLSALKEAVEWDSHDDDDVPAVWLDHALAAISKAESK